MRGRGSPATSGWWRRGAAGGGSPGGCPRTKAAPAAPGRPAAFPCRAALLQPRPRGEMEPLWGAVGGMGGGWRRLGAAAVSPVEPCDAKQRRVRRCCYEYLRLLRFSVRMRLPGPGGSCGFSLGWLGRGAPCAPGSLPAGAWGRVQVGAVGFTVGRSEKRIVFVPLSDKTAGPAGCSCRNRDRGHWKRSRSEEEAGKEVEERRPSHPTQDLKAGGKTLLLSHLSAALGVLRPGVNVAGQGLRNGEGWIRCHPIPAGIVVTGIVT